MAFEYAGHFWRASTDPELYKRFFRQPIATTKRIRHQPAMRRAMLQYGKEHPECEACGLTPIQVHHKKPAANYPELAADPDNFISLHKFMHMRLLGHPRGTKSYNPDISEDAQMLKGFFDDVRNRAIVTKSHKWFERETKLKEG